CPHAGRVGACGYTGSIEQNHRDRVRVLRNSGSNRACRVYYVSAIDNGRTYVQRSNVGSSDGIDHRVWRHADPIPQSGIKKRPALLRDVFVVRAKSYRFVEEVSLRLFSVETALLLVDAVVFAPGSDDE